jgi:hypothetical protein
MSEPTSTAEAPTISVTIPPAVTPVLTVKLKVPQSYRLRGLCIHRIMFHKGAEGSTDNYFNGSNYDEKRVYPAVNATLTLTEKGQDKPLATISTNANGQFELATQLWTGKSYTLKATLLNDEEGLLEESVETEVLIPTNPKPGITDKISLSFKRQVKNYPLPSGSNDSEPGPLLELNETRAIPLVAPAPVTDSRPDSEIDNTVTLQFLDNAALVFNSFALKVPYMNQKAYSLNITEEVTTTEAVEVSSWIFWKKKVSKPVTKPRELGKVSGSIMCFPTSTGMLAAYYGLGGDTSPPAMARQAYEVWKKEGFSKRDTAPENIREQNNKDTQFLYLYRKITQDPNAARGIPKVSNSIWTIWDQMSKVMTERAEADSKFKQVKPWPDAAGQWKMHLHSSDNLLQASNHNHLRAEISRGWPIVVGTNATAGHVMLIKGLLLNDDGSVNRVICNDPYGNLEIAPTAAPGEVPAGATAKQKEIYSAERKAYLSKDSSYQKDETNTTQPTATLGKSAYYNTTTQGFQKFERIPNQLERHAGLGNRQAFTMTNHFTLRFYFDHETIRREKMVQGSQLKGATPL